MSLHSMTGFGRFESPDTGVSAEVRTVNSRHLDLKVRLPRELGTLEPEVRAEVSGHFQRGQVEVSVRLAREGALAPQVELDREAARSYAEAAEALAREVGAEGTLRAAELLALPGVVRMRELVQGPEQLGPAVLARCGPRNRASPGCRRSWNRPAGWSSAHRG